MIQDLFFSTGGDWRHWLSANHLNSKGAWLMFYKKGTGKSTLEYDEAVEEALCFGWIDGVVKSLDTERFVRKFMPRTNLFNWSPTNQQRVLKIIADGRMTLSGLMKIGNFATTGILNWDEVSRDQTGFPQDFSPELIALLKQNNVAESNFRAFSPTQQKRYIQWVMSAKTTETRFKRMMEAISLMGKNQKNLMK